MMAEGANLKTNSLGGTLRKRRWSDRKEAKP